MWLDFCPPLPPVAKKNVEKSSQTKKNEFVAKRTVRAKKMFARALINELNLFLFSFLDQRQCYKRNCVPQKRLN